MIDTLSPSRRARIIAVALGLIAGLFFALAAINFAQADEISQETQQAYKAKVDKYMAGDDQITEREAKNLVAYFLRSQGHAYPSTASRSAWVSRPELEGDNWSIDVRLYNYGQFIRETLYVNKDTGVLTNIAPEPAPVRTAETADSDNKAGDDG